MFKKGKTFEAKAKSRQRKKWFGDDSEDDRECNLVNRIYRNRQFKFEKLLNNLFAYLK